jgi:hypothetical protein
MVFAAGAVAGEAEGAAGTVPVAWPQAETAEITVMVRVDRRNLLVIGSLYTPWNIVPLNIDTLYRLAHSSGKCCSRKDCSGKNSG